MIRVATIATVTLLSVLRGSVALAAFFLLCSGFSGGQEKSAAAKADTTEKPADKPGEKPAA